ncbi:hypothetical protein KSS87_001356 [Heliosperma pusillum]|nr:hypothetical protein KSS87_001356 [Heliosperma pusillum]
MGSDSGLLKDILVKCLDYAPERRPSFTDVWKNMKALNDCHYMNSVSSFNIAPLKASINQCLALSELCKASISVRNESSTSNLNKERDDGEVDYGSVDDVVEGLVLGKLQCKDLQGHMDSITGFCVGGGFLFSSSFDKTVNVWSLKGQWIRRGLRGGGQVVACGEASVVVRWHSWVDLDEGGLCGGFFRRVWPADHGASGGGSGDGADFTHVHTFRGHEHRVMAVVFVDQGKPLCISADNGGDIYSWEVIQPFGQTPFKKWCEEKDWRYSGIHALAVSEYGYLYTGSGDRLIKAWSLKDSSLLCSMEGHKSVVSTLAISNGVLYSGSWDGSVRLWSLHDHSPLAVFGEDTPGIVTPVLRLYAEENVVVAAYDKGLLKIWMNDVLTSSKDVHNGAILALAMEGSWLFSAGWDRIVRVQEIKRAGADTEIRDVGSIACDSVITALMYVQGILLVGCSNRLIKSSSILSPKLNLCATIELFPVNALLFPAHMKLGCIMYCAHMNYFTPEMMDTIVSPVHLAHYTGYWCSIVDHDHAVEYRACFYGICGRRRYVSVTRKG